MVSHFGKFIQQSLRKSITLIKLWQKNGQQQLNLTYVPHHVFDGNTHKCISTGFDVASIYKTVKVLRTKKASEVGSVLEAIYKKFGVFENPKVFQCDNWSEFKSNVIKLLETYSSKNKNKIHTHTIVLESFIKNIEKNFLNTWTLKSFKT